MTGSKDVCVFCDKFFALAQSQLTYKGKLYHGECFVKMKKQELEVKGESKTVGSR